MAKGRKLTKEDRARYIQAYFDCDGVMRRAAKKAKIGYDTARRLHADPSFQEQIDELERIRIEDLEEIGILRARAKSDVLLIFFLKAFNPEKYDDNIRKKRFMDEILDEVRAQLPRIQAQVMPKMEDTK